jgi:ubiquinone/menaquinone biosynthesis C-methylase UbiE
MAESETNHWLDEECARAFWDQHKALPYQELLQDTARWLDPSAGERWLDLGCGRGELTAVLWQAAPGQIGEIVSVDCNPVNAEALARLSRHQAIPPRPEQMRFLTGNFSDGLPQFADGHFDGIVSGLAISYAESRDPITGHYTDHAYNRLLAELYRVLKPGGRLVFSVNVPRPRFWTILWKSLSLAFRVSKPGRVLLNTLKMLRYGRWLRREAKRGRFHYLPIEEITRRLHRAGFREQEDCISFAGQAYLIRVRKPAGAFAGRVSA